MQKRAAQVLADKVRQQLTGINGITAVEAVQWTAGDDGWLVRVRRPDNRGGMLHINGNDRDGYYTSERAVIGAGRSLPVLLREVFMPAPESEQVAPDDAEVGETLRGYAATLKYVAGRLSVRAQDLETRRRQLPWLVLVSGDPLRLHGPYLNHELAGAAAQRLGGVALQAQAEEA